LRKAGKEQHLAWAVHQFGHLTVFITAQHISSCYLVAVFKWFLSSLAVIVLVVQVLPSQPLLYPSSITTYQSAAATSVNMQQQRISSFSKASKALLLLAVLAAAATSVSATKHKDKHLDQHPDAAVAPPELPMAAPSIPNPSNPPTLNPNPSQPPTFPTADLPLPAPKHHKEKKTNLVKLHAKLQAKLAKHASKLAKLAKPSKEFSQPKHHDDKPQHHRHDDMLQMLHTPAALPPMPLGNPEHQKLHKMHDKDSKAGAMMVMAATHKPDDMAARLMPPPQQQQQQQQVTGSQGPTQPPMPFEGQPAMPAMLPQQLLPVDAAQNPISMPNPMPQTPDSHKRLAMPDLQGKDLVINLRDKSGRLPSISVVPHTPTPPVPADAYGYGWVDKAVKRSFWDILSPEMVAAMMPTAPLYRRR
jgi:hypothetical protein